MPSLQYRGHIPESISPFNKQDHEMEQEIGGLIQEPSVIGIFCLYDQFNGFLPEFLRNLVDSCPEKACGIGVFW